MPSNAICPVAASNSRQPNEKMSDRWSISCTRPLACSGDMYPIVPSTMPGVDCCARSDGSCPIGLVDAERPSRFDQFRQPEIEDLGVAVTRDHHVVRLEIAVHDPGVMRLGEPFRHLGEVAEERRQRLPGVMDFFAQRHAVYVLHRDEGRALAVADLVDVRDVGMIERRGRALASRTKRSSRSGFVATSAGRIFNATFRSSFVSWARYTSPMPPRRAER